MLNLNIRKEFNPEYWEWDPKELAIQVRNSATKVLSPYFEVE